MSKNIITVLAAVLLSACVAYGVVRAAVPEASAANSTTSFDGSAYRTVNLAQTDYPDFTYAAENAVDAVVYVEVSVKTTQRYQIDPFFQFFFGDEGMPQSRDRVQKGSGSGVIIRQDGYIVTNNHVVANATEVRVTLNNNKTYTAQVIGTDPATDVALIKIDAEGLPVVEFADSDNLRLGEWVLAIGSPLGEELRSTITAGIVSAKGRQMPNYTGEFKIESFIQTDAAVNPGNSGGALVNKEGKLVGINTAIVSTTGSYSGYSFAVPSNIVNRIVSDLIDFGTVKRVMLGITGGNLTEEKAAELKLSIRNGVYINEVQKGSAADKAGLKKDDVIIQLGSTPILSMSSLQERVNNYHPGDKAQITVFRDGEQKVFDVTFQAITTDNGTVQEDGSVAFYGSMLRTPSKEKLEMLGLKKGVEIVSVGPGKMLEAGASEGFIIQYVNDQPVSSPKDVIDIAGKTKRAIFIEGMTANGKASYFGFGKNE
ncbi:MAG: trypsin-like peptidase domain-containing protein [Bacteroidales bacterium]|nr:trypsin-like peptidase domain-containing protein [Bacteroidales bacterium]